MLARKYWYQEELERLANQPTTYSPSPLVRSIELFLYEDALILSSLKRIPRGSVCSVNKY